MHQIITPAVVLNVTLVYSPSARVVQEFALTVITGTTLAQALAAWRLEDKKNDAALKSATGRIGIWGKAAKPEQLLKANDRIELYRPLMVDPKTARRQRFKRQGSKGAGLFAKSRSGAKAGY